MCGQLKPENDEELCTNPIWYNPLILEEPLFMSNLYKKGINIIGDLLQQNGSIISKQDLIVKIGLKSINELHYLRLKTLIKQVMNSITLNQ